MELTDFIRLPSVWRNLLFALGITLLPVPGHGNSIELYLKKYGDVELSSHQRERVKNHEYLIKYFSSLSYVRRGYTVNPDFIRALMLAESGGDQFAVSEKEALGLCQLLYSTAKQAAQEFLAKGIEVRYVSRERLQTLQPIDLFDPAINILLTCSLIAKYNHAYDGRLDLVVSAWNAGQGSITNGKPPKYPETLDLIGKINGYLLAFHKQRLFMPKG
nr:lytic transglycosylase domain-containing protein [uncultured Desulfobulbus sp.]